MSEELPADLKAALDEFDRLDARKAQLQALPLLPEAPDPRGQCFGIDMVSPGDEDIAWSILAAQPDKGDDFRGYTDTTTDGRRDITIYLA